MFTLERHKEDSSIYELSTKIGTSSVTGKENKYIVSIIHEDFLDEDLKETIDTQGFAIITFKVDI